MASREVEEDESLGQVFSRLKKSKKTKHTATVAPEPAEAQATSSKPSKKLKKVKIVSEESNTSTTTTTAKSTQDETTTTTTDFNKKATTDDSTTDHRKPPKKSKAAIVRRESLKVWKQGKGGKPVSVQKKSKKGEVAAFVSDEVAKEDDFSQWKRRAAQYLPSVTGRTLIDFLSDTGGKKSKKKPKSEAASEIETDTKSKKAKKKKKEGMKAIREMFGDLDEEDIHQQHTHRHHHGKGKKGHQSIDVEKLLDDTKTDETAEAEDEAEMLTLVQKIAALKEIVDPMAVKRQLRKRLIEQEHTHKHEDDSDAIDHRIREGIANCAHGCLLWFYAFINFFTIWDSDIADINARFGVVVSNYFYWLRRLVKLNIFTFIISFFCIIVPEYVEQRFKQFIPELRTFKFNPVHILHGEGWLHNTYLYYSNYHNRALNLNDFSLNNNAASRFMLAIILIFFLNTYSVLVLVTKFYHTFQTETKVLGMAKMDTFKRVMCGWDFSCDNVKTARILHKVIKLDLYIASKGNKLDLREMAEIEVDENYRFLGYLVTKFGLKWGTIVMHMISNLAVVGSCGLIGLMLFSMMMVKLDYYLNCVEDRDDLIVRAIAYNKYCPNGDLYLQTWILSMPALFTSIVSLVLTKFITTMGEMEHFAKPEHKVYAMMVRGGIFNLTSISVFFLFWSIKGEILLAEGYVKETVMGKEMYRLIVIQGLLDIVITFGFQFVYHTIRRLKNTEYEKPSFQPEYCAQEMFYIDGIALLGTLFCPPLSLLVTVRLVAEFYLKRYNLINFSRHDVYVSRAHSVYAPYLLTFLITYLVTTSFLIFYTTYLHPSQADGAFMGYMESYAEVVSRAMEAGSSTSWLRMTATPGFLLITLASLAALLYFCREWALAYVPIEEQLSELIMFEREDKEILLKAFYAIARVSADFGSVGRLSATTTVDERLSEEILFEDVDEANFERLMKRSTQRRLGMRETEARALKEFQQKYAKHDEPHLIIRTQKNKLHHHRTTMENIVNEIVEHRKERKKKKARRQEAEAAEKRKKGKGRLSNSEIDPFLTKYREKDKRHREFEALSKKSPKIDKKKLRKQEIPTDSDTDTTI